MKHPPYYKPGKYYCETCNKRMSAQKTCFRQIPKHVRVCRTCGTEVEKYKHVSGRVVL